MRDLPLGVVWIDAHADMNTPASTLSGRMRTRAMGEPRPLFDPRDLETTATRQGDGYLLRGVKSGVPRGHDAELFLVGAMLDGSPAAPFAAIGPAYAGRPPRRHASSGTRAAAMPSAPLSDTRVTT